MNNAVLDAGSLYRYPCSVRPVVNLLVAATIGWSSVVDNNAVCHDDVTGQSGPCTDEGGPSSIPCVSCPCRLPILAPPPLPEFEQSYAREEPAFWPEHFLHAIDGAAPPTPPPLA